MPEPWQYVVSMPQPQNHLFHVQLTLTDWQDTALELHLPVWSPGSYLVREYAKHLQDFQAEDGAGQALSWQKISKNSWRVRTNPGKVQINYRLYAHGLTVRTNHLDSSHGYFNGAATFMFVPHHLDHSWTVAIIKPNPDWQIATALPQIKECLFFADRYDTLADSPFEIGIHIRVEFQVRNISHSLVAWGEGNANLSQIVADTQRLIEVEADLFGGLPYDRYLFILHLAWGYGGLEHRNCCSLIYPRFNFRGEAYLKFLNLVAHEFFHTWNVKRIRPKALAVYDYDQENYTHALWFAEGVTSYYDQIMPLRAGLYGLEQFLKNWSETITRLELTPGRRVQSLAESSFDAWIKLYRPESHSPNNEISYYLKGEVVALLLDLQIRVATQNRRSLDDVMRSLWLYYGKPEVGYSDGELYRIIETVAETSLKDFYRQYIYGTDDIDYDQFLAPFGLELYAGYGDRTVYTGLTLRSLNGVAVVKTVDYGSPAQLAGIDVNDEILAVNGFRVAAESWGDRLLDFCPHQQMRVTLFKQDQLLEVSLALAEPVCDRFSLRKVKNPSPQQRQYLQSWLHPQV